MAEKITLWAVHIVGPDDLVPVASYEDALALACAFNDWWRDRIAKNPLTDMDPRMWASPVEYSGDTEEHTEWVKSPSPDYAPFIRAALARHGEGK